MAGVENDFKGIPAHRGPFVRTTIEIPQEQAKKGEKKIKQITIIDIHTPKSQLEKKNK